MKKILFATLFLSILLVSSAYAKKKVIALSKIKSNKEVKWDEAKRSIETFIPLVIYDGNLFCIYSETLMQEAELTIKDKYNTIVYSAIITVLPNEEPAFTLPMSNGEYMIELECNEDYYYGYFEID